MDGWGYYALILHAAGIAFPTADNVYCSHIISWYLFTTHSPLLTKFNHACAKH